MTSSRFTIKQTTALITVTSNTTDIRKVENKHLSCHLSWKKTVGFIVVFYSGNNGYLVNGEKFEMFQWRTSKEQRFVCPKYFRK
jgi:hypothetical protein